MAGDRSNIATAPMRTAADDIRSTGEGVRSEKVVVQEFVQSLERTWTGESAQTFNKAMQGYYDLCDQIKNELGNLNERVLGAANEYERTHHIANDTVAGLGPAIAHGGGGLKNF